MRPAWKLLWPPGLPVRQAQETPGPGTAATNPLPFPTHRSLPSRPPVTATLSGSAGNRKTTESGNDVPSLTSPSKPPSICSGNGDVFATLNPRQLGWGCWKGGVECPGNSCNRGAPPLPACTAGTAMPRARAGGNVHGQARPSTLNASSEGLRRTEAGGAGRRGGSRWGRSEGSRPGLGLPSVATDSSLGDLYGVALQLLFRK